MNAAERRAFEDLQRQLMEVKDQLRQMSNGEATSQRSKYVLSDADRERRDATRARDAEFSRRTGPRPLGGFAQQSTVAATDINFKSGQAFDTVSSPLTAGADPDSVGFPGGASTGAFLRFDGSAVYWDNAFADTLAGQLSDLSDRIDTLEARLDNIQVSVSEDLELDCETGEITGTITVEVTADAPT
jgi:hypothetical protein